MTQNQNPEGGCACGRVRYRMCGPTLFVHCCHCRQCQRQSGSGFAINILIEADRIELQKGVVEEVLTPTPSGAGQKIMRCPTCRVALWSDYLTMSNRVGGVVGFVRAGTLDNPSAITPDVHIFTSSKLPWVVLPEGARAFSEYYSASEEWPADSLQRLAALKG